jgi:ABC-type uncharacterized transport system permease subunit
MLSGVTTICFAGSYLIALLLEISRLLFRSGVRGALMIGIVGAGLVAHSAFLYYRAVQAVGSPLSSEQDWFLLAAWVLIVVYLLLVYYHPRAPFGLFLLPLALVLIAAATWLADPKPFAREPAVKVWGVIHGASILAGSVSVLVGFVAGLMYLWLARRLKHKLPPPRGPRLPSLEWLEKANSRAIVVSVAALGVGVVSGIILNVIDVRARAARLPWTDPVVLSTLLLFGWLFLAAVFGKFYKPLKQGRKVAYLTVVSFLFLAIALGVGLFVETRHWGSRAGIEPSQPTVGERA